MKKMMSFYVKHKVWSFIILVLGGFIIVGGMDEVFGSGQIYAHGAEYGEVVAVMFWLYLISKRFPSNARKTPYTVPVTAIDKNAIVR